MSITSQTHKSALSFSSLPSTQRDCDAGAQGLGRVGHKGRLMMMPEKGPVSHDTSTEY